MQILSKWNSGTGVIIANTKNNQEISHEEHNHSCPGHAAIQ